VLLALLASGCVDEAYRKAKRRCSVESLSAVLPPEVLAPPANYLGDALQVRQGFDGPPYQRVARWSERQFPLRVSVRPLPPSLESESARIRTAIERGLGVWERTVSDRVPTFRFKQTSAAELRFVWVENMPEHMGGQTRIRLGPGGTQLRPESIKIPFRMLSPNPAYPERLETIVAHEVGHALGLLEHSPDPNDLMYASLVGKTAEPTQRDLNTLRMLYACPKESVWIDGDEAD
jgi:hypothetical protein